MFSVPTLDPEVWRTTEPGTAPPRQRLRALTTLVDAGIKASVGMAPILPGLSDRPEQLAEVVKAARAAGATSVWANLLYLAPGTKEHFLEALARDWPEELERYEALYARRAYLPARGGRSGAAAGAGARPRARRPRPARSAAHAAAGAGSAHAGCVKADPAEYTCPAMPEEITCLIVDDHEVVREGLRLSLSRAPHVRVIGEASDGAGAVALVERRRPQVVIMDVRMPGMDGLEATKQIMEKVPETAVLIFTAYSERSLLGRGLESGAKGYILKEAPHATLLRAIEKVAGGESFVDPALMPTFLTGKEQNDMLTAREREILQLLADGMSNADVAGTPLHQPGDGQEPRAPHPREARGRHAHARGRDRAARRDHRLTWSIAGPTTTASGSSSGSSPPSRTSDAGSRSSSTTARCRTSPASR